MHAIWDDAFFSWLSELSALKIDAQGCFSTRSWDCTRQFNFQNYNYQIVDALELYALSCCTRFHQLQCNYKHWFCSYPFPRCNEEHFYSISAIIGSGVYISWKYHHQRWCWYRSEFESLSPNLVQCYFCFILLFILILSITSGSVHHAQRQCKCLQMIATRSMRVLRSLPLYSILKDNLSVCFWWFRFQEIISIITSLSIFLKLWLRVGVCGHRLDSLQPRQNGFSMFFKDGLPLTVNDSLSIHRLQKTEISSGFPRHRVNIFFKCVRL